MAGTIELILSEIASIVGKFAPLLGTVLGGPFAGIAISLVASIFGIDPQKTDRLLEIIKNDPEAMDKIKALEIQHQDTLKQLEAQNYAASVKDREDARRYAINLRSHFADFLAIGFFIYYALVLFYCGHMHTDLDSGTRITLSTILMEIFKFYFGG